jgi:hypothetical protein
LRTRGPERSSRAPEGVDHADAHLDPRVASPHPPADAQRGDDALGVGVDQFLDLDAEVLEGLEPLLVAKTQLSHTGAGDTIDCVLKSGGTSIDQVTMKTLPALAAIPVSLQAVTGPIPPSQLSVECDVLTPNGSADFSSLIAIPTG